MAERRTRCFHEVTRKGTDRATMRKKILKIAAGILRRLQTFLKIQ